MVVTLTKNLLTDTLISNEKEVCPGCGCVCPCDCTDLEKLGAEMESPFAKEWDKKNNCKDTVYSIQLVA